MQAEVHSLSTIDDFHEFKRGAGGKKISVTVVRTVTPKSGTLEWLSSYHAILVLLIFKFSGNNSISGY